MASKRDPAKEAEALQWVTSVVDNGTTVSSLDDLRDGVILCELVNKVKPGSVARISRMNQPFKKMENIDAYIKACAAAGVPQAELFMTVDLYEDKNPNAVFVNLYGLARVAGSQPGWTGPTLGPKLAEKKETVWTEEQKRKSAAQVPLLLANIPKSQAGVALDAKSPVKCTDAGDTSTPTRQTMGAFGGANASGQFDDTRNPVKVKSP
jgi:hypothetical protein